MRPDSIRFRVLLPIVVGLLFAILMLGVNENDRMIGLMGMRRGCLTRS